MNIINGNLDQVDNLEGQLSQDSKLTGELSLIDNKIVGELTNIENFNLSGFLSQNNLSMEGILSIPPEIPVENYHGEYTIIPKPFDIVDLKTKGLRMVNDIIVNKIPYYKTSNENGYTVYIGGD